MDLQLTTTLALVALAGTYLFWSAWRLWRGQGKKCGGCGSHSAPAQGKLVAISLEKMAKTAASTDNERAARPA